MCFNASLQDVDASEIKVQVCVYAFDLLYLNGEVRPDPCVMGANNSQRSFSGLSSLLRLVSVRVCMCLLFASMLCAHRNGPEGQ